MFSDKKKNMCERWLKICVNFEFAAVGKKSFMDKRFALLHANRLFFNFLVLDLLSELSYCANHNTTKEEGQRNGKDEHTSCVCVCVPNVSSRGSFFRAHSVLSPSFCLFFLFFRFFFRSKTCM